MYICWFSMGITGQTYRCQQHSPTFYVLIYLYTKSIKIHQESLTDVHTFPNLLTHIISYHIISYIYTTRTHTCTHIACMYICIIYLYIYIYTHIYVLNHKHSNNNDNILTHISKCTARVVLPEGPCPCAQETTVPLWQREGWDDHLLAGAHSINWFLENSEILNQPQ